MSTAAAPLGGAPAPAVSGVAFAFLGYVSFSCCDASIKAVGSRLSPFEISTLLTLVACLVIPFLRRRGESWADVVRPRRPVPVLLRALMASLAGVFSVIAFTSIPLAEVYAVGFVAPGLSVILAVLVLRERVGWQRWVSVVLGVAGVLVVMRPGFRILELGHAAALAAAFSVAVSLIVLRTLGSGERRSTMIMALFGVSLVITTPLMLWQGFLVPEPREVVLLLMCGVFAAGGQVSMLAAARRADANRIAPAQYSQMAWAVLFGAAFFKEFPDGLTFAGLALVAASGMLLIERRNVARRASVGV